MLRLPAEWETQSAVLIAWPRRDSDFGEQQAAVEESYLAIAEAILDHERLIIVCEDTAHREHIAARLAQRAAAVIFVIAPYRDIWVRDTAPLTVYQEERAALRKFRFNGWGNKYPAADDDALGEALHRQGLFGDTPWQRLAMILEGGSIDSDGRGTLLTTAQCLLNPNRNTGWSKQKIEAELAAHLGATRVLWIDQPALAGDDTDAHIDTLARFCNHETIAYTACDDSHDSHYASLQCMQQQLQALRTVEGQPYRLIPLPLPAPIHNAHGQRLPANYANFLLINGAVLVPSYGDAQHDAIALQRLAEAFPERSARTVPCLPLVQQYGSLHCMTMQFPAGVTIQPPC